MQVVHERCCGLDVHKKTVVACVLVTSADGRVERTIRTFGTMTGDLLNLADWLDQIHRSRNRFGPPLGSPRPPTRGVNRIFVTVAARI